LASPKGKSRPQLSSSTPWLSELQPQSGLVRPHRLIATEPLNAWAKSGVSLVCGDCKILLVI
jgi:hypothetical protein